MLVHDVYFTLRDKSPRAITTLLEACKKYLRNHPGVEFFACGTLEPELARPVNDRGFDVALHVVFHDRASHDLYQEAPAHKRFIEENRENWESVRVFDSITA
jgi:hypothetical protein